MRMTIWLAATRRKRRARMRRMRTKVTMRDCRSTLPSNRTMKTLKIATKMR
jgi:hypothetical protein